MFLRRTTFISLHPQIRGSGVTIGITIAHTTYYFVSGRLSFFKQVSCVEKLKYMYSNKRYRVLYM